MITIPGNGIFTVHTGKEIKEKILPHYNMSHIRSVGLEDLDFAILGVPFDGGAGLIRGSNWGPLYIRNALIEAGLNLEKCDLGDLKINPHLLHDDLLNDSAISTIQEQMYEGMKLPVSALSQLEMASKILFSHGVKTLFLGGDHSISYPIVKSWVQENTHSTKAEKAIIHFDAHTDLLEKRLGIEHCFGTWAFHAAKVLASPAHLLQFGIRSSGKDKHFWEKQIGIKQWWAKELLETPMEKWTSEVLHHLQQLKVKHLYVSFDVDVLDPSYLSSTGTAESLGLFPHHIIGLLEVLKEHFIIDGFDVVEFAPFIHSPLKPLSTLEPENSLLTLKQMMPKMIQDILL
jgi:agmatinase